MILVPMLTVLLILISVSILSILITVSIWSYANKENPKSIEISKAIKSIAIDFKKILDGFKLLAKLALEVAQPLLSSQVVDVSSEDLSEEMDPK